MKRKYCKNHYGTPVHAKGLCSSCYNKQKRRNCPELVAEEKSRSKRYYWNNLEKERKRKKEWWKHKGKEYRLIQNLLSKYNLTVGEYNQMMLLQHNRCAICRKEFRERLSVDHCHKTLNIRGLLCRKCNTILAMANDDRDILLSCINYLTRRNHEVKNQ